MNILVTGGAGFIGSAVVRHLLRDTNYYIINVDKLTYSGNLESIPITLHDGRYSFEQVDICNGPGLDRVLKNYQPDVIMHLAAESHVDRSIDSPSDFIHTNIVGTYTLLETARKYWIGLNDVRKAAFRFHHISTDEVYGDLPHPDEVGDINARLPLFTETTSYAPSSPYSACESLASYLWFSYHRHQLFK